VRHLRRFLTRTGNFVMRRRRDERLKEEIEAHLALQTAENIKAGLPPAEARRQAKLKFGAVEPIKEDYRAEQGLPFVVTISQDVRYGARMLRKSPGFTVIAILTLALGIGANAAMFSVIEAVLLRPLPYSGASQLVRVASIWHRNGANFTFSSSPPDFFDWRDQNRSFSSMFAYYFSAHALTGNGEAKRVRSVEATARIFNTLQSHPSIGREFTPEENRHGAGHVAVLSYGFWQSEFGGRKDAIGKTIQLDSEPYTVIGVMPAGFRFPLEGRDVYLPIGFGNDVMKQRGAHYVRVLGRLRDGVTLAQANDDLGRIMEQLRKLYPDKDSKWGVHADRWSAAMVGDVRPALLVLLAAVGLVALIACANISNLLLARATVRQREFAMRKALGAANSRLVRQMLTEGLLLSIIAGAASLLLAHWVLLAIVHFGPKDIPRLATAGLDASVLVFTLAVSLLSTVLFGLLPALRYSLTNASALLKMAVSSSREAGRARNGLLIVEVALSMMLLAGAGLLLRSFVRLASINPGFEAQGILTMDISLPDAHYKDSVAFQNYWNDAMNRLRGLPGVTSVGAITPLPLSGDDFSSSFSVQGRNVPEKDNPSAEIRMAAPDYFQTMGIPLIRGRLFTKGDHMGTARVLLISEAAARLFFPAGDAMGQYIRFGARGGNEKNEGEIVGIVGDVRHFGVDAPVTPMFYVPLAQAGIDGATVVIHAQGSPALLGQPARKLIEAIDGDALVSQPVLMKTLVAGSLGDRRFYLMLLGAFAGLALSLALVGLYGVISYSVAQRTQEIGVRVALGATRIQVLGMVMKHGLLFAGLGVAAGEMLSLMLNSALKGLLVGVSSTDPLSLAVTGALLLLAAAFACYIPARRAMSVDPMTALRNE
jgi:predicted permease